MREEGALSLAYSKNLHREDAKSANEYRIVGAESNGLAGFCVALFASLRL
jgi:hypothetical protein